MDPYKIDFFALRVLSMVFELKSFSAAADALGVNQSVVSYAVNRMRDVFDDPLFLRQGGGIVPTDRCIAEIGEVDAMLQRFETMITPQDLDPDKITKNFRVSCNYFERIWIMAPVIKELRKSAPKSQLTIMHSGTQGASHLVQGTADLLIGPMRPEEDGYYCRSLLKDSYVCVMDPSNPLASRRLTLERYIGAQHVAVAYGDGWTSDYLDQLPPESRNELTPVVTVPSPGDIQTIVQGSDLIATLPRKFAMTLLPDLTMAEFPLPSSLEIGLVWSARTHGSVTQKWFRDLVVSAVKSL